MNFFKCVCSSVLMLTMYRIILNNLHHFVAQLILCRLKGYEVNTLIPFNLPFFRRKNALLKLHKSSTSITVIDYCHSFFCSRTKWVKILQETGWHIVKVLEIQPCFILIIAKHCCNVNMKGNNNNRNGPAPKIGTNFLISSDRRAQGTPL